MSKLIFVNLPVADLPASVRFYEAMGATRNPQFSDDTGTCMVFSDVIHVMLLTHCKYRQFTRLEIADARRTSQVLLAISVDSRAEVDRVADAVLAAGGAEAGPPQDHGFMYARSLADPDGHVWEPHWMDVAAAAQAMAPQLA